MGRDKAGLRWGDATLIQHVVSAAAAAVDLVVVAAGPDQELPALSAAVTVVRDREPGRGPLQGLATAFAVLDDEESAVVVAVDQPFLRPAAIRLLAGSLGDADVAAPFVDGQVRPLPACYRTALRWRAQALLEAGERRLRALLEGARVASVPAADLGGVDALADLDTAAAYERARAGA
jgi:molybdopterin-guanine dinucleotide biosynthesis protein A